MEDAPTQPGEQQIPKFGMFTGVFIPTLLTILGVIMYLRLGWVVGSAGLLGAWTIIIIAYIITTTTALSMSSIISNMRIGAGGAYSIISRTLGLEIGGSVGVPLYLSLALSVAMYIFGFREGVRFLFPQVPALLLDITTLWVLFVIVLFSTDLAFRIQYIILAIIIGSLISVFAAGIAAPPALDFVTQTPDASFWIIFAVFFPAATGIMAGANMSGELKDPRWSIPVGTLGAIGVSLVIYLSVSYWLAANGSAEELTSNFNFMLDNGKWSVIVLAGLLAATFSSALNSLVGASRILHAMGEQNILPFGTWISHRSASGIPRNAIMVTGLIVFLSLMLRELNTIAPLITLFFLITYCMINVVILVEERLGLVSFRPLFKVPTLVPLIGTLGCVFAMFIINPAFSLIALFMVAVFYNILMYRHLKDTSPYGDVRSSLFVSIAEWAAKKSMSLPKARETAWKPHLLIPILSPTEIRGISEFVRDITFPNGSVSILGINRGDNRRRLETRLPALSEEFEEDGIYAKWTIIDSMSFADAAVSSVQALKGSFFPPNIVFLRFPEEQEWVREVLSVIQQASGNLMGVLLFAPHPKSAFGRRRTINLWIARQCMEKTAGLTLPNCDLALLIAYKLKINWEAKLTIIAPAGKDGDVQMVTQNLQELVLQARIPVSEIRVVPQGFNEYLSEAPQADLEIFSLPKNPDPAQIRNTLEKTRSSCLFCRDSTNASALI
jgi:amino acid transporter